MRITGNGTSSCKRSSNNDRRGLVVNVVRVDYAKHFLVPGVIDFTCTSCDASSQHSLRTATMHATE